MTQENDQVTDFDVEAWQNTGKTALEALSAKRSGLQAEIEAVDVKIVSIKESLGIATKPKRIRLRPLILQAVEEKKGKYVTLASICGTIHVSHPDVEDEKILTAVKRAVHDVEGLEMKDDEKVKLA